MKYLPCIFVVMALGCQSNLPESKYEKIAIGQWSNRAISSIGVQIDIPDNVELICINASSYYFRINKAHKKINSFRDDVYQINASIDFVKGQSKKDVIDLLRSNFKMLDGDPFGGPVDIVKNDVVYYIRCIENINGIVRITAICDRIEFGDIESKMMKRIYGSIKSETVISK